MLEAVEAFQSGAVAATDPSRHVRDLYAYATSKRKTALATALRQRYPGVGRAAQKMDGR